MTDLHDQVPTREKVLVIGAGPAGLAAAAALQAVGLPFDLVDRAKHVGGIWNLDRADTPVWPSLEMVSSRTFTQYEEMLQPVSYPDFLSPEQMAKYLRAYAARHQLTEHFRPGVEVRSARPFEDGVWQVELSTGEIMIYRAVISAHGISERPHRPAWAADVPKTLPVMHAKEWEGADGLEGRRVLVVGSGQSAADIAVDAARRALEVRWSMRTGHWVVPRRIGSTPGDVAASREPAVLGALNEKIAEAVVSRAAGDPVAAGLPEPEAGLLEDSVIISDDVLDRVREGRISPIGEVTGVVEGQLRYADGAEFVPDLVVLATGYRSGADHLPEDVVPRTPTGELDLFLGAFPRGRDDLVILGQQRVSGGVLPVLVQQADIAALMLRAVTDGSAAADQFRRARGGSEAAVPTPEERRRGRLGRLGSLFGGSGASRSGVARSGVAQSGAARAGSGQAPAAEAAAAEGLIPFRDRDALLGRLETVRTLFE